MSTPSKVPRMADNNGGNDEEEAVLEDFGSFAFERVLSESTDRRMIVVLGRFPSCPRHPDAPAVIILEKTPFGGEDVARSVLTGETKLKVFFRNDVYGKYDCALKPDSANVVKASVIHPATPKHIRKYESSPKHIIYETPALYKALTLPFLEKETFDKQWIYNILNHKKESETIVYEDEDCDDGFVLLPDYKWNGKQTEDLYLVALTRRRDIASIRDLREEHLQLLDNIWNEGCKAIQEKYGIPKSRIRAYFHYQPSFYHLHVHFTQASYAAPGSSVEGAHLLPQVIHNLRRDPNHYQYATIPFAVKESENIFAHYKTEGYDFGDATNGGKKSDADVLNFLRGMGRAKHEPCGEHWTVTYGESAWRMALMALCLPRDLDRSRIVRRALTSALTSLGEATDHSSEWPRKLRDVRSRLSAHLPPPAALGLFEHYCSHVDARRGVDLNSPEDRTYRKLMEFEETMLLWEEMKKEGEDPSAKVLLKKMIQVGFPGSEKAEALGDTAELEALLRFLLQASVLVTLKRTGWVRSRISHPETVAGHMFRMAVMAMMIQEEEQSPAGRNVGGLTDAVTVSLVHDVAECIVGDITPKDKVTPEEKHEREMSAMRSLVKDLPGPLAAELYLAFERYESQRPGDKAAALTKDLDKFDMILQADEYERREPKRGKFLQEFFDSTEGVFRTERVSSLVSALRKERDGVKEGEEKADGDGDSAA